MQAMESKTVEERKRVEAVVETLAAIYNHGESLVELAHDARNMVTALSLYCDLLEEPGVLPPAHRHYGSELRLVAEASRSLVEKLALLDERKAPGSMPASESSLQGRLFPENRRLERPATRAGLESTGPALTSPASTGPASISQGAIAPKPVDDLPVDDLREEVLASRNVLAAIAGPAVAVNIEANGGASPVRITTADLIRVLVNLVKNAAEGIAGAGTIRLGLTGPSLTGRSAGSDEAPAVILPAVILVVDDSGPGIPENLLDRVFEPGFTTRASAPAGAGWASGGRRGLGLAITRSIVEAAGGTIHAGNRSGGGARFEIKLPVRTS